MSETSSLVETIMALMSSDDGRDERMKECALEMARLEVKRTVLYLDELKRRERKFIPAQVMRPIFLSAGLPVGPMLYQNMKKAGSRSMSLGAN